MIHIPLPARARGFTLLELLIALALSVMVMVTLAAGMYVVTQDWQRTGNRLETLLDDSLIMLQLERALEGTFPYTYLNRDDNKRLIFFEGDDRSLRWVSTVSLGQGNNLNIWSLSEGRDGGLNLKVIPAFAGNPTERLEETEGTDMLVDYNVSFEYLYVENNLSEDKTTWVEDWSLEDWEASRGLARLPNGVRMVFENQAEAELTAEIVVPIFATNEQ